MTTKKKRIHELAKELGLSAQILVAKLQARGFDVKGPQSALDEFTLLQAQGMLEAEGIVAKPDAPEASSVETSGGLTIRKKKKRTSVDGASS